MKQTGLRLDNIRCCRARRRTAKITKKTQHSNRIHNPAPIAPPTIAQSIPSPVGLVKMAADVVSMLTSVEEVGVIMLFVG